jgi:hypothetical protein
MGQPLSQTPVFRRTPSTFQSSGDGLFVVLLPDVDERFAVPVLVRGLVDALGDVNKNLDEHIRLHIRLALHRGWVGNVVIAVHRLLDAPILRTMLRGAGYADLALIVPDVLLRGIIVRDCHDLAPAEFLSAMVDLPDKDFNEPAWVHLPVRNSRPGS